MSDIKLPVGRLVLIAVFCALAGMVAGAGTSEDIILAQDKWEYMN